MMKLSTGQDSTLKSYLELTSAFFGIDSPSARFIREEIDKEITGEEAEVIADESQMMYLFFELERKAKA